MMSFLERGKREKCIGEKKGLAQSLSSWGPSRVHFLTKEGGVGRRKKKILEKKNLEANSPGSGR